MGKLGICILLSAAGLALGQHNYTPTDVEDGGRLFRGSCVSCHGADGALVPGIDLAHGRFRRATTDDSIVQIIRNGIPGTPMPPGNFSEFQAGTIVAYLRSLAAATKTNIGNANLGKAIFEGKGECLKCHRVDGRGSRVGPDLSDIGTVRRPDELERSVLDPDAEIRPENRYMRVVKRDGAIVTGRVLTEDTFTIQLLDSNEKLTALSKSDLREFAYLTKSPMPSYRGKLTSQELADLVGYLASLKGIDAP